MKKSNFLKKTWIAWLVVGIYLYFKIFFAKIIVNSGFLQILLFPFILIERIIAKIVGLVFGCIFEGYKSMTTPYCNELYGDTLVIIHIILVSITVFFVVLLIQLLIKYLRSKK